MVQKIHAGQKYRLEKLRVVGIHCATCAVTIEKNLRKLLGILNAKVSFATNEAEVKYDSSRVVLRDIIRDKIRFNLFWAFIYNVSLYRHHAEIGICRNRYGAKLYPCYW